MFKYILFFALPLASVWSCTDLVIQAEDGAFINGMSLEFVLPMKSKITLNPRGIKKQSSAPNNKQGLAWTTKYGYISIDALDQQLTTDGMSGIRPDILTLAVFWYERSYVNQ